MNILLLIIILLAVLIVVVAYNMHQENQYRQKIRSQFGHADSDALLNASHRSTRDGQTFAETGKRLRHSPAQPETQTPAPAESNPPKPAAPQTQPENPKTESPQAKPNNPPKTPPRKPPTTKSASP